MYFQKLLKLYKKVLFFQFLSFGYKKTRFSYQFIHVMYISRTLCQRNIYEIIKKAVKNYSLNIPYLFVFVNKCARLTTDVMSRAILKHNSNTFVNLWFWVLVINLIFQILSWKSQQYMRMCLFRNICGVSYYAPVFEVTKQLTTSISTVTGSFLVLA